MKISTLLTLALLIGVISAVAAPQPLGTAFIWNGAVTDSNGPVSGPYSVRFSLSSDDQGANVVYGPIEYTSVLFKNGVAAVAPDFGSNVFNGTRYFLVVQIRREMPLGSYETLNPPQEIKAAPYALHAPTAGKAELASHAASVNTNAVNTEGIQNNAVRNEKLDDAAVDGRTIKGRSIVNNHLADQAVNGRTIMTDTIENTHLKDRVVTGRNIDNGTVASNHLAAASVIREKLGPKAVGGDELDDVAVDDHHIKDGAVKANKLGTNAVTTDKVADGTVTSAKMANASVGNNALVNGAVTLAKINTNGAVAGQALYYDGTNVLWQAPAGNGGGFTNLNASNLASGIVPDPRLSNNVPRLNANQTFTGVNTFSNNVGVKGSLNVTNTVFAEGIRLYSATLPTSITLFDASNRGGNLALSDGPNHYSADAAAGDIVLLTGTSTKLLLQNGGGRAAITVSNNNVGIGTNAPSQKLEVNGNIQASGMITGNGAGLTSLNAANLTGPVPSASLTSIPAGNLTGAIADARLSANVALLNANQVFSGPNTFSSPANSFAGVFTGNGAALTSLNANNLTSGIVPGARLDTNVARLDTNASFQGNLSATGKLAAAQLCVGQGQALIGLYSSIAGGVNNSIEPGGSFVGGGINNFIVGSSSSAVIAGGSNNRIEAAAAGSDIGGGSANLIQAPSATISGGASNRIQTGAASAAILGGTNNAIFPGATAANISGGEGNVAGAAYASMGGGKQNMISNPYGTVAGGFQNNCLSDAATVSGGADNTIEATSPTCVIAGGWFNKIEPNASSSVISGGSGHLIQQQSASATISGGFSNRIHASASNAAIGGGTSNAILPGASSATVGGGEANVAGAAYATVNGGQLNVNGGTYGTIAGGSRNTNNGIAASMGGGFQNSATGGAATVPGGDQNSAWGASSFAAGHRAKATNNGAFVWADSTEADVASTGPNQFIIRASGGLWMGNNSSPSFTAGHLIETSSGAYLTTGGMWTDSSDRNAKEHFTPLDGKEVLARLARLPVSTWNYKAEDPSIRHAGPVAQDFHAAFGLGQDDRHIAALDANGVALAAIQGLNQKLEAELKQKEAKVSALEQRLAELEKLVDSLARKNGGAR